VHGIVRRANAEEGPRVLNVEAFMEELRAQRASGYAECDEFGSRRERVLALPLRAPFGIPAAIGIGVDAGRLPVEREDLLRLLDRVAENIGGEAPRASTVGVGAD
jgi:DNA-binding IclR family transcriptional regulator